MYLDELVDSAINHFSHDLALPVDMERELLDSGIDVQFIRETYSK